MNDGSTLPAAIASLLEQVDDSPVLTVHEHERPVVRTAAHGLEDHVVLDHASPGIRHEHLEAGRTLSDQLVDRGEELVGQVGDYLMETPVDNRLLVGALVPVRGATRGSCPFCWTGKSMIDVVPPIAAATVPE